MKPRFLIPENVPFSADRSPVFYGWIVVGAATLGILFSIPGQTMGVSAFTDALLGATGLSRLGFSNAYLLGTLASAAVLPYAGRTVDRFGVRVMALLAAVGLGLGVLGMSQVDRLAQPLIPSMGSTSAHFLVLVGLFFVLRFTGQGVLTLASRTMLARWFERRRGVATAASGVFVSFGFAAAPQILDVWLQRAGWRGAYQELAMVELIVVTALVIVLFREDPESSGLALDGGPVEGAPLGPPDHEATLGEALTTRAFWVLTLALAIHGMTVTGITLHVVDLGAEGGLDRAAAVAIFVPLAVVSTAIGALAGWLADQVPIRTLILLFLVAAGLGYAGSAHLGTPLGFFFTVVGLGVAGGHFSVLTTVGLPRFFGRRHLGAITGASMTAIVVGSALGPSLLALSRSVTGSYAPSLYVAAALPLALALLALWPLHPRDQPPAAAP